MTAPVQLDPADLASVVDLVKGAGFKSVSYDPDQVKLLPGVWIRVDTLDVAERLADGCCRVATTIHLIVRSKPVDAALVELLPLLDQLCTVLTPTGPVALVGVNTGLKVPLPALAVPHEFQTVPTEETP